MRRHSRVLSLVTGLLLAAGLLTTRPLVRPTDAASPCPEGKFLYERWAGTDTTVAPAYSACVSLPRADAGIPFTDTVPPDAGSYTARWTGSATIPAGTYLFSASASDGLRVVVDGQTLVDSASPGVTLEVSKTLTGAAVPIVITQRHASTPATAEDLRFSWTAQGSGGVDPCPGRYLATYRYADHVLAFSQCADEPTLDWTTGLAPNLGSGWKVTFTGQERFKKGDYTFRAQGDGRVTVTAGATTIFSNVDIVGGGYSQVSPVTLAGSLPITFTYTAAASPSVVALSWSRVGCSAGEWQASYYDDANTLIMKSCEATPDYDFATADPAAWAGGTVPSDYRIVWERAVSFGAGLYQFAAEVEGSNTAALAVGSQTALAADTGLRRSSLPLAAGDQVVSFTYVAHDPGRVKLSWNRAAEPDPEAFRRCPPGTYLAEYTTEDGTSPSLATCETRQADWGLGAPDGWVGEVGYTTTWSGDIFLPPGSYTFQSGGANPAQATLNQATVFAGGTGKQAELAGGAYRLAASHTAAAASGDVGAVDLGWMWLPPDDQTCAAGLWSTEYSGVAFGGMPVRRCSPAFPDVFASPEAPAPWVDGLGFTVSTVGKVTFAEQSLNATGEEIYHFHGYAPAGADLWVGSTTVVHATGRSVTESSLTLQDGALSDLTLGFEAVANSPVPRLWWESEGRPRLLAATVESSRGPTADGGNQIRLQFDRGVRWVGLPDSGGFAVTMADGTLNAVTQVNRPAQETETVAESPLLQREVVLTLDREIQVGDVAWLSYTPNGAAPPVQALPSSAPLLVPLQAVTTVADGGPAALQGVIAGVAVTGPAPSLAAGSTLEIELGRPYALSRVELVAGSILTQPTEELQMAIPSESGGWRSLKSLHVTAITSGQTASTSFAPALAARLRITNSGTVALPVTALRLFASPPELPAVWLPAVPLSYAPAAVPLPTARLSGKMLEITYDRALDPLSVPFPSWTDGSGQHQQFRVTAGALTARALSVQVSGKVVRLYLDTEFGFVADPVTLEYQYYGGAPLRDANHRTLPQFYGAGALPVAALGLEDTGNATQSSVYDDSVPGTDDRLLFGPGRGKDNDLSTALKTRSGLAPWWQLELQHPSTLQTLNLLDIADPLTATPTHLVISVSVDGNTWTEVRSEPLGPGNESIRVDMGGRKVTYLRLELRAPADAHVILSIAEVRLSGVPDVNAAPAP